MLSASRAMLRSSWVAAVVTSRSSAALRVDLDVDERVDVHFLGQRREAADEASLDEELGPQSEDVVTQVSDGQVQRVDGAVESGAQQLRMVIGLVGRILEAQGDAVDRLDDAVMQFAPDALALLDHRQLADAEVQSSVLDGDGSMTGERLDQLQVRFGERSSVTPIGQVQVADGLAPNDDRHADEAVHRRVSGRKARPTRVVRDVRDEVRATLTDDEAEQASASWQVPDPRALGGIETAGDEAIDLTLGIDDAKGCIARLGQVADAVDDELEDGLDVEHRGDGTRGDVQGGHALGYVTGLRSCPGGVERQLDGARRLLDLIVRARHRARIDDQATQRHAAVVGRQGRRLEGRSDRARPPPERADAKRECRQGDGVDVEMGASQAIRRGQS